MSSLQGFKKNIFSNYSHHVDYYATFIPLAIRPFHYQKVDMAFLPCTITIVHVAEMKMRQALTSLPKW